MNSTKSVNKHRKNSTYQSLMECLVHQVALYTYKNKQPKHMRLNMLDTKRFNLVFRWFYCF